MMVTNTYAGVAINVALTDTFRAVVDVKRKGKKRMNIECMDDYLEDYSNEYN